MPSPRLVSLPCEGPPFIGVIIAAPTGVIYQHQCGGYGCNQMRIEGYLLPVQRFEYDPARDLEGHDNWFAANPAELRAVFHTDQDGCPWGYADQLPNDRLQELATLIALLGYLGQDFAESRLEMDPSKVQEALEAWVPVITPDGPGVLVWNNCD